MSVGLTSFTVFTAAQVLGWPSWRWAFFGLGEVAAALSWYARGRTDGLIVLVGGMGLVVLIGSVIQALIAAL